MKIPLFGIGLFSDRRLRLAWQVGALAGFFAATNGAFAQLAISTLAGSPLQSGFVDATGTAARFSNPTGVAVDSAGNTYVADAVNNRIRKVTTGGVVTTLAGSGSAGGVDATGVAATFSSPQGVAIDSTATNLYVADTGNHKIRKIVIATGVVTTIAGTGSIGGVDNATGTSASFNSPIGISVDSGNANILVADTNNSTIRLVALSGVNPVTTLAGSAGVTGTTDATGTAARFNRPQGLSANSTTLFVADTLNHSIRSIVISTGVVTTLAGSTSAISGSTDATGTSARFSNPAGLAVSGVNLFVSDTGNNTVRQVVIASGVVTTVAGSAGSAGNGDGLGTAARFQGLTGIGADGSGNLYIADTINQTIRRSAATAAPAITSANAVTFAVGSAGTFTVTGTGSPASTFTVGSGFPSWATFTSNAGANTATIGGTPPNGTGSPFSFTITANNGIGTAATQTFTLTVQQSPTITSANNAAFVISTPGTFTVTASAVPAVTSFSVTAGSFPPWASLTTNAGANTATLSGTPLNTTGSPFSFTISATNGVGSPATQSFTLTVGTTAPPVITSQPSNYAIPSGQTSAAFSVSASGNPAVTGYQWERQAGGVGSFVSVADGTPAGVTYSGATAATMTITGVPSSMNGDVFRVIVTNGATTTSNAVTLSVPPVFTSISNTTFGVNQSGSFTFTATGSPTPVISQSGSLPSNIIFTGGAGVASLSGTTTDSGTFTFTVSATNSGGTTTQTFTLNVLQPSLPVITSSSIATFVVNQPGSFTFTASGSPTPTFSLSPSSLPSGLQFNSPLLNGTPTSAENSPFTFVVTATNGSGSAQQTFTLTIQGAPPTITANPIGATANVGGSATFTASASGTPTPNIRWQRQPGGTSGFLDITDSATYGGTQTGTLTVNNIQAWMSGDQFRISASNNGGTTTGQSAILNVNVGTTFITFAGLPSFTGANDGTGTNARFNSPSSLAVDFAGNIYIADTANHVIRKMTPAGLVTTLAGFPGFPGSLDGVGSAARFNSPQGVAVDSIGNVYVADTYNNTIRIISISGAVSTLAGSPGVSGAVDDIGSAARFALPTGIVVDLSGTAYVADTNNHAIRRVLSNGAVTTFAGAMGSPGSADNSVGTLARFSSPNGLARDSSGNLYVADSSNHIIRKITTTASVSTLAGIAGNSGVADGDAITARFNRPYGVAVDASGNVYVADTFSSTLRKVTPSGDVTTVAGSAGLTGSTDGVGAAVRFNQPFGVVVDASANIYVADTRNHTIRRNGTPTSPLIAIQPTNKVAAPGQSVTFTANATGAPVPGYQWQRQPVNTFGFFNIPNNIFYSGTNTNTLTIGVVTSDMNGDQFRVVANNGVSPVAESNAATLTIGVAPVFTSGATATFQALQSGSFTVAVDSILPTTFSLSGNPSWLSINPNNGVLSGTAPDTSGSPHTFTVVANNGVAAGQTFTLTITPAVLPPTIAQQPASATVNQSGTATFTVSVTGTAPFSYQWRRDGGAISGATGATLQIPNVQNSAAGVYTVNVTNAVGNATSNGATLTVNSVPVFTSQPRTQTVLVGDSVIFSVSVVGGSGSTYQWRKNGTPIPGGTGNAVAVNGVTAADAGNYDVQVTNPFGIMNSSLAQLVVVTAPTAPIITAQPSARTVVAGAPATFTVSATGAPQPGYQWRKNGSPIPGQNGGTLTIAGVQASDNANYDVVVSNSAGSVTSAPAGLTVISRSYAGIYFGSYGNNLGDFAIYVRDDNTGVFLSYLPGSSAPVMNLNVRVNDAGQFSFSQGTIAAAAIEGEPSRAAALQSVTINGTLNVDGTLSGSIQGGASGTFTGARASDTSGSPGVVGYYQAGAAASGTVAYTIAGPNNVAFVVIQSGTGSDGGRGLVTSGGNVSVTASRSIIVETINGPAGFITGSSTGGVAATFSGASDVVSARQRLVNISSRARVATGDSVAIAGFVISGGESKPVLIRAVGPTIGAAPFNVPGALASPRLELFRGSTSLAVNTGIAGNRGTIDAAGVQAGAFALGAAGADAAILTTLAPGNYTAVVSSTTNTAGVALVEVYDLSAAAPGQKLLNIATRAPAGTGDNILIAGFVVPPGSTKRVLVRGVGPGLAVFGVTGVLAQPILTLFNGSAMVAQNTNWSTSTDSAVITTASAQAGAFGLATNDSALVVTLAPGNYTAQVAGVGGTTGVALIEVYELP